MVQVQPRRLADGHPGAHAGRVARRQRHGSAGNQRADRRAAARGALAQAAHRHGALRVRAAAGGAVRRKRRGRTADSARPPTAAGKAGRERNNVEKIK